MAATANTTIRARNPGRLRPLPVDASQHLFGGWLAFFEVTAGTSKGYGTSVSDGGANAFAGVVVEEHDNMGGAAGDGIAEVYTEGGFAFPVTGAAQSLVGLPAYATADNVVTDSSADATLIGEFSEFVEAGVMRVELGVY